MMYQNLIIDCTNLYWRSVVTVIKNSIKENDEDEREFYSASIQDSLIRIQEFIQQFCYKNYNIYILCDNPFSKINEREHLYPSYKHARKNKNIPAVFYKSLDKLLEIIKVYNDNFYLVRNDGCEADDLVPIILNQIDKTENTLLISADMDWARDISDNIHWFNYTQVFDIQKFKKEYGFNPNNNGVKMYKCIHGDRSDCIENAVPYLPNSILLHIVDKYASLQELFNNLWSDNDIPKQWKLKIKDCEIQLKINYQLVDYIDLQLPFTQISYKCIKDIEKLRSWFLLCDIPFFNFMMDIKKDSNNFIQKKKQRRYGNF
jgi:hypothetical protein